MSDITTIKKYNIILEEFSLSQDKTLTAYDEALTSRLSQGTKQLGRLLADLESEFDAIVKLLGIYKYLNYLYQRLCSFGAVPCCIGFF